MVNRDNGTAIRVVPAIDLLDGNVVRLRQGRYDQVTEYPVDPGEVAATYALEDYQRAVAQAQVTGKSGKVLLRIAAK